MDGSGVVPAVARAHCGGVPLPDTLRFDEAGLLRRTTLLDQGFRGDEIDRMLRSGQLTAVRRGVYRRPGDRTSTAEEEHALRSRAAAPTLSSGAVFGHVTAAVLLRLPLWNVPLRRLHVVRDRSGSGQVRRGMHVHGSPLVEDDVVELNGVRVTSAARTAADLARSLPTEPALVTVDAALHRAWRRAETGEPDPGAATAEEIAEVLARFSGRPGSGAARRVLALADERSESPGESRSRLRMHLAGLPPPVTQWTVPGTNLRTDFAWPGLGVVGEFDGKVKYGRAQRPGEDLREVLWREKRREDRIRATGLTVVRWTWSDITDGGPTGLLPQLYDRLR